MQLMEASIKTRLQSSLWKLNTVSTLHAIQFQWPHFQFHCYWTPCKIIIQDKLQWLDLRWYYTPHCIICISIPTSLHPLLVCAGRNAVICGNSSCFGTTATGRDGEMVSAWTVWRCVPPPPARVAYSLCMQTFVDCDSPAVLFVDQFIPAEAVFNSW